MAAAVAAAGSGSGSGLETGACDNIASEGGRMPWPIAQHARVGRETGHARGMQSTLATRSGAARAWVGGQVAVNCHAL